MRNTVKPMWRGLRYLAFAIVMVGAYAANATEVEAHECLISNIQTGCGEEFGDCDDYCFLAYNGSGNDCDGHVYGLAENLNEYSSGCTVPDTWWEGDCQCDSTPV